MSRFNVTDITHLENAGSPESLGSKIGLMIRNSASVNARVEEITFETGAYAIVLRGVLKAEGAEDGLEVTRPIELEADIHLDAPERTRGTFYGERPYSG